MDVVYLKIAGAAIFYVLMFSMYWYALGRYKGARKREQYLNWVDRYGASVRRSVIALVVIYTVAQVLMLIG